MFINRLPPKLQEVLETNNISTTKQILTSTTWDLQQRTNLNVVDIQLLKNIVAESSCPESITCDNLLQSFSKSNVSTGCVKIDSLLKGGFLKGIITELHGESGSGKTQLALQTALNNSLEGTVYICTEGPFPIKRYEQLKLALPNYNSDIDYGKNIFVEHITEPNDLLSCVRVRMPKLLSEKTISVVILDSVAAPFRTENYNYIQRAEDLRELAVNLIKLAQKYNLSILCINQVSSDIDANIESNLPALGLAWSNMVNTRLCLKKTSQFIMLKESINEESAKSSVQTRELSVTFSPYLPSSSVSFIITAKGLQCL